MLEGQLTSLATKLESNTRTENIDRELAVVTCSTKVVKGKHVEEEKLKDYSKNQGGKETQCPIRQNLNQETSRVTRQYNENEKVAMPIPKIIPPFPHRLKKINEEEKFKKISI